MTDDELPDVPALRELDPPPNGVASLRAAIARDDERRTGRRRWLLATAPVAVVIALVLWSRRDRESALEVPPAPAIAEPIADPGIAPEFYWVSSSPRPVAPAPAEIPVVEIDQLQPVGRELR